MDPVTIVLGLVLGVVVLVTVVAVTVFFLRTKTEVAKDKFESEDEDEPETPEQIKEGLEQQRLIELDVESRLIARSTETPKEKFFRGVVTFIMQTFNLKGIVVEKTDVENAIFGDEPKSKIGKDGTVHEEINVERTIEGSRRFVSEDVVVTENISIQFSEVLHSNEILPVNKEDIINDVRKCVTVTKNEEDETWKVEFKAPPL